MPSNQLVVRLTSGETIVVRRIAADVVLVENPGRWRQRLSREEAWQLLEALDEAATYPENATEGK